MQPQGYCLERSRCSHDVWHPCKHPMAISGGALFQLLLGPTDYCIQWNVSLKFGSCDLIPLCTTGGKYTIMR